MAEHDRQPTSRRVTLAVRGILCFGILVVALACTAPAAERAPAAIPGTPQPASAPRRPGSRRPRRPQ